MAGPAFVLVVEDEAIIQSLLEDELISAGYTVETASKAEQAMRLIESDPERIQAIITDIRLGQGYTGWDVARRARMVINNLPIVYMTGDSGGDWTSLGVSNSILVAKPFDVAKVVTAVSVLIAEAATKHLGS